MRKRRSHNLAQLKRELHQRAIKEQDEEKRREYWRLYFKAQHAESEVREMVMDAEIRRLIEFLRADGQPDDALDDPNESQSQDTPIDDDDIPPRQKGLWD